MEKILTASHYYLSISVLKSVPTVEFGVLFKNAQFEGAASCWVAFAYIVIISLCLTAGDDIGLSYK